MRTDGIVVLQFLTTIGRNVAVFTLTTLRP